MRDNLQQDKRAQVLGCYIDRVDMQEALDRIALFIKQGRSAMVVTLNAEIIYRAMEYQELQTAINRAELITPDGIGVIWAGKILGLSFPERVTGIDLLHALCRQAAENKWRLFLLGAAPQVAEQAGAKLAEEFPGLIICGVRDGYFKEQEEDDLIDAINKARPDIVAVALGAPKQEFWMSKYKNVIKASVMIGVGGSLDVLSGLKKRAPQWIIKLNMEWLYRLLCEPGRWKRQMALPLFIIMVLKRKLFAD